MGARRQKDWEATIYSKYENSVTLLEYIVCVVAHSHKTKQNKKNVWEAKTQGLF